MYPMERQRAIVDIARRDGRVEVLALAAGLGGCMTLDHATSKVTGDENVVVSDYGWRLFNVVPLFRPEITHERVQKKLLDYAAERGKYAEGLVYNDYETVMFNIPTLSFTIPVPYILCYQKVQVSGVLK